MCVCKRENERLIDFKELTRTVVELTSLKSAGWADKLETQKSRCCGLSRKEIGRQNSLFLGDGGLFVLRTLTDCINTPTLWKGVCFTQILLI